MRVSSSCALAVVAACAATSSMVGAASTEYPACTTQQTQQYFSALSNELSQCQKTSTFDFTAGLLPTLEQRSAVCKCTPLIKQLPNIRVPRCKIRLDGNAYKFQEAITSIFAECGSINVQEEPLPKSGSGSGEVAGEATPVATTANTTQPTATEDAASSSSSSGSTDTSIETVPEPTTKLVVANQETPEPATTTPAPTTAAPTSSAASLFAWSVGAGIAATTTALLTV